MCSPSPEKAAGLTKIAMPFVHSLHFIVVSSPMVFFPLHPFFRFTSLHLVFILLQLSVCFDFRDVLAASCMQELMKKICGIQFVEMGKKIRKRKRIHFLHFSCT